MKMFDKQFNKLALFGGLAGLVTTWLLSTVIVPILDVFAGFLPTVSLKLSTISVSVRESLTGINGGVAKWLIDAMGLTTTIPFSTYVIGFLGGAVFFLLGHWVATQFKMLKGNDVAKTRTVIWFGSAATFAWMAIAVNGFPQINIDLLNLAIAWAVNAWILAYAYVWIDKQFNLKLLPY